MVCSQKVLPYLHVLLGSLAVTQWWNNEEGGVTFITGLNCSGTEHHILDCPIVDESPVCSSDYADANVVCQGTTVYNKNFQFITFN